jgi:hypothetical protein
MRIDIKEDTRSRTTRIDPFGGTMRDEAAIDREALFSAAGSRRTVLAGAVAGFVLAAAGVFVPESAEHADARDGALGGQLGGRRGTDHRGRHRRRSHGDKKGKRNDPGSGGGGGKIFRDVAIYVHNFRSTPVQVQGWALHFETHGEDPWYIPSGWDWATIPAKPPTGSEPFKDFVGPEWDIAVRIGTDRIVRGANDCCTFPAGYIYSGGWDAKYGWNPKGDILASDQKMHVDDAISTTGIKMTRLNDSPGHIQYLVELT